MTALSTREELDLEPAEPCPKCGTTAKVRYVYQRSLQGEPIYRYACFYCYVKTVLR